MRKLNPKGFGAVEALLILAIVVLLLGTGWYAWRTNQDTNGSQNKSQIAQNNSTSVPTGAEEDNVIFTGAQSDDARELGTKIQDFYKKVLLNQNSSSPTNCNVEACNNYKTYLTENALHQLKQNKQYSQIACGQMKIRIYSVGEPKITTSSATAKISILPVNLSLEDIVTGQLTLKKLGNNWLIDSFSCNL